MSHTITDRTIIQTLVSIQLLSEFISDPDEEESPLSTVYCYLSYQFIEGLLEQILSDGANTHISCLSGLQSFIQLFLKIEYLNLGSWGRRNILYPELAVLIGGFLRRQDGVQEVFGPLLTRCYLDTW